MKDTATTHPAFLVYKGRLHHNTSVTGPNNAWSEEPRFPLQRGIAYQFGRGRSADIHFFSNTVARSHMLVTRVLLEATGEERLLVVDLMSTNGIAYKDRRSHSFCVAAGDTFEVAGQFLFSFEVLEEL